MNICFKWDTTLSAISYITGGNKTASLNELFWCIQAKIGLILRTRIVQNNQLT